VSSPTSGPLGFSGAMASIIPVRIACAQTLVLPSRMVVYPRQPHGIQEPKLMLDAMNRNRVESEGAGARKPYPER